MQLLNVLPTYFSEDRKSKSDVWGKEITIGSGELVKIVAPSGSGKTSLIHFLYGLRHDYSGEINFGKGPVKAYSPEDFAAQRAAELSIVLQDMRLLPELTLYENLYIKHQLNPYHPLQKIEVMAEQLGIKSKLQSKAKTCSYGEQQRAAVIRSLLQPFRLLLLDEPFSHLDSSNSQKALSLMLEEAASRQAAVLLADLELNEHFPYTRLLYL